MLWVWMSPILVNEKIQFLKKCTSINNIKYHGEELSKTTIILLGTIRSKLSKIGLAIYSGQTLPLIPV